MRISLSGEIPEGEWSVEEDNLPLLVQSSRLGRDFMEVQLSPEHVADGGRSNMLGRIRLVEEDLGLIIGRQTGLRGWLAGYLK